MSDLVVRSCFVGSAGLSSGVSGSEFGATAHRLRRATPKNQQAAGYQFQQTNSEPKQNVLLVIDVQDDYCKEVVVAGGRKSLCAEPEVHTDTWQNTIKVIQKPNEYSDGVVWDAVICTQDVVSLEVMHYDLKDEQFYKDVGGARKIQKTAFCLPGTPGACVVEEVTDAISTGLLGESGSGSVRAAYVFGKNKNDAFNEDELRIPANRSPEIWSEFNETLGIQPQDGQHHRLDPNGNLELITATSYPQRAYDLPVTLRGPECCLQVMEAEAGNVKETLAQKLLNRGFAPGGTKIAICGLQADMCVFTTAMHARSLGYDVAVVESASRGNCNFGWTEYFRGDVLRTTLEECDAEIADLDDRFETLNEIQRMEDEEEDSKVAATSKNAFEGHRKEELANEITEIICAALKTVEEESRQRLLSTLYSLQIAPGRDRALKMMECAGVTRDKQACVVAAW